MGEITGLQIYALLAPLLLVGVALVMVVLTRWQDEREEQKRRGKRIKAR